MENVNKVFCTQTEELFRIIDYDKKTDNYAIIWLSNRNLLDIERISSYELINKHLYLRDEDFWQTADPYKMGDEEIGKVSEKAREKGKSLANQFEGFIKDKKDDLFWGEIKSREFDGLAREYDFGFSGRTFRRQLSKYFERGQDDFACIPDHRSKGNYKNNNFRRPGKRGGNAGKPGSSGEKPSTEYIQIFDRYYQENFVKRSNKGLNRKPNSKIFAEMMKKEFTDSTGHYLKEAPTIDMWYRYIRTKDWREIYKARKGENDFKLKKALLTGDERMELNGFGELVQIDSTIMDIVIVDAEHPERRLGRPVLYVCVDALTKFIPSFYVSLENASYRSATELFLNYAENTQKVYKKQGISFVPKYTVENCLPAKIMADNAELARLKSDKIVEKLHIDIENARSYRPTDKGSVERIFRMINDHIKQNNLPGAVYKDNPERGDELPAKKAALTLHDVRELVASLINEHNTREIEGFHLKKEEALFGVRPIPVELMEFYCSAGRDYSVPVEPENFETFGRFLLPSETRSVRRNQIELNNLKYGSEDEDIRNWLERSRGKKFTVFYDPRDVSEIYLDAKAEGVITLTLTGSYKTYAGLSLGELKYILKNEKEHKQYQDDIDQDGIEAKQYLGDLTEQLRKVPSVPMGRTTAQNVRENRKEVAEEERPLSQETAAELTEQKYTTKKARVKPFMNLGAVKKKE